MAECIGCKQEKCRCVHNIKWPTSKPSKPKRNKMGELFLRIIVLASLLMAGRNLLLNHYDVATFFLALAILLRMDYKRE